MSLMPEILPAAAPGTVRTMHDVEKNIETNGPQYLLQALRTLRSHTRDQPLASIPAEAAWVETHFPKVRRGVHPRADLNQPLEAYKKWRADLLRAIDHATGTRADKAERRGRSDAWRPLLEAAEANASAAGGPIPSPSLILLKRMADLGRRAEIMPKDLSDPDAIRRLEVLLAGAADRKQLIDAFAFLEKWRQVPAIARQLPTGPLVTVQRQRDMRCLPEAINTAFEGLVGTASSTCDEIACEDARVVSDAQLAVYRAALRHHYRALADALQTPENTALKNRLGDIAVINDIFALFSPDAVAAAIRQSALAQGEGRPGAISVRSVANYYAAILVVLRRNGMTVEPLEAILASSRYVREGKAQGPVMSKKNRQWCEALLKDPERERRFRSMHRILRMKVDQIFAAAQAEHRALTWMETSRVRQMGTVAAAVAIELAGRPIRLSNVLGLRFKGSNANFFPPGKGNDDYSFLLSAEETKAGKEEPPVTLRRELYGPQTIAWYLEHIRPLFAEAASSIYLFPAVKSGKTGPMCKSSFDNWFQRAATEAGLPMTFHKWRHGYATLLLDQDPGNLQIAADMLGNTPEVCARTYAFIDKAKVYKKGQSIMIARAKAKARQ